MLNVTSEVGLTQRTELEKEVDEDIELFSKAFQTIGDGGLIAAERAIIKTYLAWKLGIVTIAG